MSNGDASPRPLRWRIVLLIQRLISLLFPPLHSIRWKLFVFHLAVLIVPAAYFVFHMLTRGGVHYESRSEHRVIHEFVRRSLLELAVPGLIGLTLAALLAWALSYYITRVISDLAKRAERIAAGDSDVRLETWTKSELGTLARAVEKMRRKLEGKAYVEEMVTNLSHELKTPLASIRGAAEVLEDGALSDPEARVKFLGNIQSEVQRLDRIVSELLKLSRIETHPGEWPSETIDAVATAAEIAETYRTRSETLGIRFTCSLPSAPVRVQIPEAQLKQLFANLLDNALQFTPAGRAVKLVVSSGCEIRVRDEGEGIDAEILPKIFDRFFTTENPRTGNRGTGLGLAIAKSIVETNHGTISVRSEPGRGAEFVVRFPEIS